MALSTIVKIGSINNLSDARYCAGMGVDLIGFCIDENHPDYISLAKFREITGWVAGVKTVAELENVPDDKVEGLINEYKFDYIETRYPNKIKDLSSLGKHIICRVDINNLNNLPANDDLYYYLIESKADWNERSFDLVKDFAKKHAVLVSMTMEKKSLKKLLSNTDIKGIELKGGNEISPGLKDFDDLSDILEMLEID